MAALQKPFLATFFLDVATGSERAGAAAEFHSDLEAADARAWAVRMTSQTPKVVVRELAGLDDDSLSRLRREVRDRPHMPLPLWSKLCSGGGLVMVALGAAGLATNLLPAEFRVPEMSIISAAVLAVGAVATAAGWFSALRFVPVVRAYDQLGHYVRELDEQHPWLYEALDMLQDKTAAAYQQRVLAARGAMRGVDVHMMRFAAQAQSEVLRCLPAGDAVRRLQTSATAGTGVTVTTSTTEDLRSPAATH